MGQPGRISPIALKKCGSDLAIRAVLVYVVLMGKCCSVENCESIAYRRSYCVKHYMRFKRHGDPEKATRRSPGSATDEDRKRWKREEYQRNKESYKARAEKWRSENNCQYLKSKREYLDREDVKEAARARTKQWREENPERKSQNDKEWRANNVDKKRSYQAFRRAKVREATPPWLTKEHRHQIALIYEEALRLSRETGVLYHVDHIVPLAGREVSGLHVPWNLRAIPAAENHKKSNKLEFA